MKIVVTESGTVAEKVWLGWMVTMTPFTVTV
jgi:hypothetical protein